MNQRFKHAVTLLAAACALAAAGGASAQSAGQFTAKIGAGKITPKVDSGDVSAPALPGSKVAVGSDTEPVFIFAYGITDNISAELDLGLPYKHKLYGAGAIAGHRPARHGRSAATERVHPVSLLRTGRHGAAVPRPRRDVRLLPEGNRLRPVDGAAQYRRPIDHLHHRRQGGQLSVQAGVAVNINPKWFVDLTVVKIETGNREQVFDRADAEGQDRSVRRGAGGWLQVLRTARRKKTRFGGFFLGSDQVVCPLV